MRIPFSWLSEFIDIGSLDPYEVAEKLSLHSVEAFCERVSFPVSKALWGEVISVERKGDLTHLKIRIDGDTLNIVTKYEYIKPKDIVAFVPHGETLNGVRIEKRNFNGIVSEGVLLSYADLGIDAVENMPIKADSVRVGSEALRDIGEGEIVLEVDILPNRGDLLSVKGIAREVAFLFNKDFRDSDAYDYEGNEKNLIDIEVKDKDCGRYRGAVIEGVNVGESPLFIKRRLYLSGIKLINNVVDVTNYIMLEEGQPLHAFDLDKVKDFVEIRSAKEGESIVTLDGDEKKLSEVNLVIADREGPIAIAGVVGGKRTGTFLETKNLLLEAAYFNPFRIRKSAKSLDISTDSSYRFERNVDIENLLKAQNKAIKLILELAGGKIAFTKDIYIERYTPKKIYLSVEKYYKYTSREFTNEDIEGLVKLGFEVSKEEKGISVSVPAFRSFDVRRDVDIVEEIMRRHGYENYDSQVLYIPSKYSQNSYINRLTYVREFLTSRGFFEVINLPFDDRGHYEKFGMDMNLVKILNPLNVSESFMRGTLLFSLIKAALYNLNNYNRDISIFEISKVFSEEEEKYHLGLLVTGVQRLYPYKEWSFEDIASVLRAIFETVNLPICIEFDNVNVLHPNAGGSIYFKERKVGYIGRLHPEISDHFDIPKETFVAEIDLQPLLDADVKKRYSALSKYPPVIRDLSLLMDKNISVYKLLSEIQSLLGKMIEEVKVFDVYTGDAVGEGKKSVGIRLYLRSEEGSLTNEDVNRMVDDLVAKLEGSYGVKIR